MKKTIASLLLAGAFLTTTVFVLAEDSAKSKDDAAATTQPTTQESKPVPQALNYTMKSLAGKDVNLAETYKGKVVLMVNTASKCGLTPQYAGLEKLHEKYSEKGLAILGFPANNFGAQEPGTNEEIGSFCEKNYGVKFDMFSKISVKGDDKAPLYQYLTALKTDTITPGDITWNFEKFLIGKDGKVVARFSPKVTPESEEVTKAIETELAK